MRRILLLSGVVCAIASVVIVGSALARGGKNAKAPQGAQRTVTARELAQGKPFTTKVEVAQAKGETLVLLPVTIHGEEFAFVVDTGAAQTQITSKFAEKLGLKKVGKPVQVTGIGCKSSAQGVEIDNWSIAGHALPAAKIDSSTLKIGAGTKLAGLLGSDIWSKFGSLQVDYANETITVG